jgi:L-alanine-DL-glutamate epimerase-like enolase superfamily enzyme
MKIREVEIAVVGKPSGLGAGGEGEFLVSPLHAIPSSAGLVGDNFEGLRGGPAYAVLVRIHTDDGISGVGSAGVGNGAAAYVLRQHLRPLLLGQDPFNVEVLWETMYRSTLNYGRKGLVVEAISAVDIALWDIMGKAANLPVFKLLGGRTRDRIAVYGSRLYALTDLDKLAGQAAALVKQGFRAVKQRFGYGPNDGLEGMRANV